MISEETRLKREKHNHIRKLYKWGMRICEIAREYEHSQQLVYEILKYKGKNEA